MSIRDNLKNTWETKIGMFSCVAAFATMILYIAMQSIYFTPVILGLLLLGIAVHIGAVILNFQVGQIFSYICYLIALYRFLIIEIDLRMDIIVDTGVGTLDRIFFVECTLFFITIITAVISSCRKA